MARIVLATIGSLGDLHPFIAIGRALISQGHCVVLAVPEDGVAKVRAAGLDAASILPGYTAICARLGLSPDEAAAKVLADTNFVVDQILFPSLRSSAAALDQLSADADVIAGSIFALASDIVAEKRNLPLTSVAHQPMTLFSAWQPPMTPRFEIMRHQPRAAVGRGWNRTFLWPRAGRPASASCKADRCRPHRTRSSPGPGSAPARSWPCHRGDNLLLVPRARRTATRCTPRCGAHGFSLPRQRKRCGR